jgi:hypothetical protein
MDIDLFGNIAQSKELTPMQRLSTRQVSLPGRDLYTTESKDIERFLKALDRDGIKLPFPVWEPAAGRGDISKTLKRNGIPTVSSDIIPYEDNDIKITQVDFLLTINEPPLPFNSIFTNPPFNMQEDFLLHALTFNVDVLFFVRLNFLSSIRRYKIYRKYAPAYVYVYSARAHCYKDGDKSKGQNMIDYCVIMWKPPYVGKTKLRWIE